MIRPVAMSRAANNEALVVMTAPLDLPRSHRQQRLRAVERLNL